MSNEAPPPNVHPAAAQPGGFEFSSKTIDQFDVVTALMLVHMGRTEIIEGLLRDQIGTVQNTNKRINLMNELVSKLNVAKAYFPRDAASDAVFGAQDDYPGDGSALERRINDLFKALGINPQFNDKRGSFTEGAPEVGYFNSGVTFGQITKWITDLQSAIESQTNTQQSQMLNLQGLSNRRNESYELLTNWLYRNAQTSAGIIANIRT